MKLVIRTCRPMWALWWAKWMLFACGAAMLAYCGFVLTDTFAFQKRENQRLARLLLEKAPTGLTRARSSAGPHAVDGLIGRIEIQRLGLSAIVMEGADESTLRRAAGHITGTDLPGQPGNVGIAGHRDTFFRPLRNIRRNDIIALTTLGGEYDYRVVSSKVVRPSDVGVLATGTNEVLTLVTCYPFYFVGPAPYRFIVRAERVGGIS